MNAAGWCEQCGTRHTPEFSCRNLEATEPERVGWRVQASSAAGTESFAALIARCGSLWRARVITLPNMVWSIPGGRCSMKFVADSAEEVECQAKRLILEVCKRRGMKVTEAPDEPPGTDPAVNERSGSCNGQATRNPGRMRVLYGIDRATQEGRPGDLSKTGLFIGTDLLVPEGRRIKLLLEMEHAKVPLEGTVIWVREHADDNCPKGMGVELHRPPALYLFLMKQLQKHAAAHREAAEPTPA